MISFAPRFLSLRFAASMTMSRKTPSKGSVRRASVRSMVCPVKSRPRRSEPIILPASSTASSQLRVENNSTSSLEKVLETLSGSLPTSHLFLEGRLWKPPVWLDICSSQTSPEPHAGHLFTSYRCDSRKSLISRYFAPPNAISHHGHLFLMLRFKIVLKWQRVRDLNPCTSLERAVS